MPSMFVRQTPFNHRLRTCAHTSKVCLATFGREPTNKTQHSKAVRGPCNHRVMNQTYRHTYRVQPETLKMEKKEKRDKNTHTTHCTHVPHAHYHAHTDPREYSHDPSICLCTSVRPSMRKASVPACMPLPSFFPYSPPPAPRNEEFLVFVFAPLDHLRSVFLDHQSV